MANKDHVWVPSTCGSALPSNAFVAGHDCDGSQIYIGRAKYETDLLPAKVIPYKRIAYVCFDGREVAVERFHVLCGTGYKWVSSSDGSIPVHALVGGKTSTNERLYIGRAKHAGSITIGKIHPSHRTLYIPFGGSEISIRNYEILLSGN